VAEGVCQLVSEAAGDAPIHVLEVVAGLHAGGAEMLVSEFARAAPEVGVRVSVYGLDASNEGPAASRLEALGIDPHGLGMRSLLDPRDLRRLRRHVAAVEPDIVHTHLTYPDIAGGLAARSLALPAVSTIHSDQFGVGLRERTKDSLAGRVRRRCCRRVIAVSAQARRTYLSAGWDTPERVVTVRNGVSAEARPGSGVSVRRELDIEPGAPVALMLSVLRPEKRHATGIEAVRLALRRDPGLRLLVAGDGSERPAIEAALAELGGAARYLGHREDPMELLDASDMLLHSSSTEAFPTAMVEAMAASVPIVAIGVGGIPEVVRDGENGLLIDPPGTPEALATAIGELIADDGMRRRLGAAGRRRYESELTGTAWARRLRAVYDEVLAGS
jgi:glycosyltransferase involved in cell wall biosynthesis